MRLNLSVAILSGSLLFTSTAFAGAMLCSKAEREAAERAMVPLAARGQRAIPRLVRLLGHSNRCMDWMARRQLVKLGEPSVRPVMEALLRTGATGVQDATARALAALLCDRGVKVKGWPRHRRRLLRHLARGKVQARGVLRLLDGVGTHCSGERRRKLLRLGVRRMRRYLVAGHPLCDPALDAVPDGGRGGKLVTARVVKLLAHEGHRERALRALRRIGPGALPAARATLARLLRIGSRADRVSVAHMIKEMKGAAHFLDELFMLLAETNDRTVLEAIVAGGGPRKEAHVRVLRHIAARPGPLELRHLAVQTLNQAGKKTAHDGPVKYKHKLWHKRSPVYAQRVPPLQQMTRTRLRHAVNVCRAEARLSPIGDLRLGEYPLASHDRHGQCLDRHLCGPKRATFRRVQKICCKHYSGSRRAPAWCR